MDLMKYNILSVKKINNCRIYIEVAIILSSSQLQEFNPLIAQ